MTYNVTTREDVRSVYTRRKLKDKVKHLQAAYEGPRAVYNSTHDWLLVPLEIGLLAADPGEGEKCGELTAPSRGHPVKNCEEL